MGRTIYYERNGKITKMEEERIMEIERKYNKKYRWRGEKLSLSRGFTKIYDSDRDVHRLIMAIIEISMKIPEKKWRIQDDENIMDGKIKKGVFTGKIDLKKWMKCGECFNVPAWTVNRSMKEIRGEKNGKRKNKTRACKGRRHRGNNLGKQRVPDSNNAENIQGQER